MKLTTHRMAELVETMGDKLSDDGLEGFAILQEAFKEGIDESDRFLDLQALWKSLDTPAKKQSLNDSLAAYKTAVQGDSDAKFWIKGAHDISPSRYRYMDADSIFLNQVIQNGELPSLSGPPGWFVSFDQMSPSSTARSLAQIDPGRNMATYRFEFDVVDVKDDVRLAFDGFDSDVRTVEPLAKAYPNFGSGGASQGIIERDIPIRAITKWTGANSSNISMKIQVALRNAFNDVLYSDPSGFDFKRSTFQHTEMEIGIDHGFPEASRSERLPQDYR